MKDMANSNNYREGEEAEIVFSVTLWAGNPHNDGSQSTHPISQRNKGLQSDGLLPHYSHCIEAAFTNQSSKNCFVG